MLRERDDENSTVADAELVRDDDKKPFVAASGTSATPADNRVSHLSF